MRSLSDIVAEGFAGGVSAFALGGSGNPEFTQVEVDLGAIARRSGKFTIPGTGLTVGKPVMIQQAVGPYTGKGARADEAEMDQLAVTASVTGTTAITAYWTCRSPVRGNRKFLYLIGA